MYRQYRQYICQHSFLNAYVMCGKLLGRKCWILVDGRDVDMYGKFTKKIREYVVSEN